MASKIAQEVLRDNPKIRQVHSGASIKMLLEKEAKKQRIYTEMANKQIKEVIATMMSVVDYEETGSHTDGEDGARVSSEGVTSVQ